MDMMAHLEAECAMGHYGDMGEMAQEWEEIKTAMQRAPLDHLERLNPDLGADDE